MKQSIKQISFLIALTAGLAACGGGNSGVNEIKINAADDTVTIVRAQVITINILGNDDSDASLTGTLTQPAHGIAVISKRQIIYTPNINYTGIDDFTYEVTDPEGNKATAKVTITISNTALTKYNGIWKSGCKISSTRPSRSFKQTWTLNGRSLTNNVLLWHSNTLCQSDEKQTVEIKANIEYKDKVSVATTCAGEKAQQVNISYLSLKTDDGTISEEEQNIRGLLGPLGISISLPKYGLICIGNDGKLYRGLITADKDASTAAKRPTEMDTTNPLAP